MSTQAHEPRQSIRAMRAAGPRSVHLERHSLLLFGGVGGGVGGAVAGFTDLVITADRFPEVGQRTLALAAWPTAPGTTSARAC